MKNLVYFLAASMLFIGCNVNEPEMVKPNQPSGKYAKYWSPAEHTYTAPCNGNVKVITFIDESNYISYVTDRNDIFDLTGIETTVSQGVYEISYPAITLGLYTLNERHGEFKDTLTLSFGGHTDFILYK